MVCIFFTLCFHLASCRLRFNTTTAIVSSSLFKLPDEDYIEHGIQRRGGTLSAVLAALSTVSD